MFLKRCFATGMFAFLLAAALLAGRYLPVQAAPPAPIDIPITQPDGTTIMARQWGDEWQHGMETVEGYSIVQSENGYWVYAAVQPSGELIPAQAEGKTLVAGRDAPEKLDKHARPTKTNRPIQEGTNLGQNFGTQPLLLVLVDYQNNPHVYDASNFGTSFFGPTNSIVDYYKTASFNQLTIGKASENHGTANDGVVGWLRLSGDYSNNLSWNEIARQALTAANPYVNYAAYDADGDGYVTSTELHTVIVVSGYEQSYCGSSCLGVWAHRSSVGSLYLDGKYLASGSPDGDFGGYAMFGEIHGQPAPNNANNHPATIGVMIHELGHDLSWPDLYDTNGSTGGLWSGAGEWSIMASGSWNSVYGVTQAGGTPALPDAWLKAYQGWITPTLATAGNTYNLPTAGSNAYALQLGTNPGGIDWNFYKQSGTGEYWLVENRQLSGYDAGLPGCGILIYHVDETVTSSNAANGNRDQPLLAVEEADGQADLYNNYGRGDSGDAYPGYNFNQLFGNLTNPHSRTHTGGFSEHTVSVISTSCSSTMQLQYTTEHIDLPYGAYMPFVANLKPPKIASGKVTYKGAGKAGIVVRMDRTTNNWDSYDTITTTTNASGDYNFGAANTPQAVSDTTKYVVYYQNTATTYNGYVYYWNCNVRTGTYGSEVCNFDIADVTLKSPAAGAKVNLPYTFYWNRRPTTTDSYELDFLTDSGYYACWTYQLGYVSSFRMTSLSANLNCMRTMYPGLKYWRWMWVYGPNGYGVGWYRWSIYFNDSSSPELSPGLAEGVEMLPVNQMFDRMELMERFEKRQEQRSGD